MNHRAAPIMELVEATAMRHGVTPAEIFAQDNSRLVAQARNEIYAVLRDEGHSCRLIGYWMGRSHKTVYTCIASYKARQKALLKSLGMV